MTPEAVRAYFLLQRRKGCSIPECVAATDFMIAQDLLNDVYARLTSEEFHALLDASHVEAQLALFQGPAYLTELAFRNKQRLEDIRYVYAGGVKVFRTIVAWYDEKASADLKAAIRKATIGAFVHHHEKLARDAVRVFTRKSDGTSVLAVRGSFAEFLEVVPGAVAHLYQMALGEAETTRIRQEHNRQLKLLQDLLNVEAQTETAEFQARFAKLDGAPS